MYFNYANEFSSVALNKRFCGTYVTCSRTCWESKIIKENTDLVYQGHRASLFYEECSI